MSDIWTNDRYVAQEQEQSSPIVAVLLAVVCWAGIFLGMLTVLILAVAGNAESVLEAPDVIIDGASAVWFGLAMILATRVAAGVLRRRGMEQFVWLAALPAALLALGTLFEGLTGPLWPAMLQAALGLGGSIAAVTLWSPAPSRRRRDG